MALPQYYARRKRLREKTSADVYQYTEMSQKLRQQVIFALEMAVKPVSRAKNEIYGVVRDYVRGEQGKVTIGNGHDAESELNDWLLHHEDVDEVLDVIEAFLDATGMAAREVSLSYWVDFAKIKHASDVLNARFAEAGFGYEHTSGQIVQINSQFAHAEIVVPALTLLDSGRFPAANEEFRKAHEEFRHGDFANCVTNCGRALESVLKVLASEGNWEGVNNGSNLSPLIRAAIANGVFPGYMEEQLTGLRQLLQGAGTVRNNSGAHGAGTNQQTADKRLAAYQIHQTAAALLFIADAQSA